MATSRRISRFSVSRGARDRLRSSSVHSRRLTCNLRNQSSGSAGSCATPYSCRSIPFQSVAAPNLSISNITHADSRGVGPRYNTCRAGSSLPAMGGDGRAHWLPKLDGPFWFWPPGGAVHDRKRREKPSIEECRMPGWVEKDGLLLFQDIDSKSKVGSGHAEATVHCTGHVLQATSMRRMFPNSV